MLSIGYIVIAIVDFVILVWAARMCLRYRTSGLIFTSIPLLLLWFDNFTVGIGSTLGEGDLLIGMNVVRFVAHYVSLPMIFIGVGALAREAGFGWAKSKWVMGAFCAVATFFIVYDLWLFSQATLYPSCYADTLRYTTHIADYTACSADAQVGVGTRILPIPAITLTFTLITFGTYLWAKIGWKWLTIGAIGVMFLFAIPYRSTGGIFSNIGEPILSVVILVTAIHIARRREKLLGQLPK
ncbi:MAG: hypothetical protein KJO76_01545 [Gammaproteobacteria bacterium]|nr:hypothetical protein [Gammaproteobacteria bacterium]MBT8445162.1 hypothetical protein [Gammaproteobacteria bacterium]